MIKNKSSGDVKEIYFGLVSVLKTSALWVPVPQGKKYTLKIFFFSENLILPFDKKVNMVQSSGDNLSPPKSWGDVRMVVLGDSHIGSLSFKDIPESERPRLRARSLKGAKLHQLLPKVESEITGHSPHLVVVSVGHSDMTHTGCQHFKEPDHQHRLHTISYDFNVKLAADEIFRQWHSWLAKYSCKVLFALTFPMDFQEYNYRKLKHCPECQELYNEGGQRDILHQRIKEWGDLLKEQSIPVMYLDDVLDKINPDYLMNDAVIAEEERALLDGLKLNPAFAKNFYYCIREAVEKAWPNFVGGEGEKLEDTAAPDSPPPSPSGPSQENDKEEAPVVLPAKKKSKHAFRF